MYEIALSVSACLRSKTRADIAWMISSNPSSAATDALLVTPGGGRIGVLLGKTFDGQLAEVATRQLPTGRILELSVSEFESVTSGLAAQSKPRFIIVPAHQISADLWPALLNRELIALVAHLDGTEVVETSLFTAQTIALADSTVVELFNKAVSVVVEEGDQVISIYAPITKLVIAGSGVIAEALAAGAMSLGWQVQIESRPEMVSGFMAALSPLDCAVIMGHDVEISSRCLASALESDVGYIGALGSKKMQENREDWLAYRDITDISRVHGPAGFDIGAQTPAEIAISILAQAINVLKGS